MNEDKIKPINSRVFEILNEILIDIEKKTEYLYFEKICEDPTSILVPIKDCDAFFKKDNNNYDYNIRRFFMIIRL